MKNLVSINELTVAHIARIYYHTFLNRSEAYREETKKKKLSAVKMREEAFWNFLEKTVAEEDKMPYAICVRPEDIEYAICELRNISADEEIIVASVVGFPDGSHYSSDLKAAEARFALMQGAKEIDMVMNYKELKEENWEYVEQDINKVMKQLNKRNDKLKLILETCELSSEEIIKACEIATKCEVHFVKTSTGFGRYGARAEDVKLMKEYFAGGIKISGGVDTDNYKALLKAASGRDDGLIELNPNKIRIGESSLLDKL